ncbi:hypothetical protein QTP88_029704 [Uroleucon formosanum]
MARAQRTISLRTIRAYRTVSADATAVLSAMMPADLIAHERARAHQRIEQGCAGGTATIKKEERAISTTSWQKRWDRSTTGRWTHRLLPNVRRWMEKPPMDLTFHMTQARVNRNEFNNMVESIMTEKEADEREEQSNA